VELHYEPFQCGGVKREGKGGAVPVLEGKRAAASAAGLGAVRRKPAAVLGREVGPV
jgi:hypothetical protein